MTLVSLPNNSTTGSLRDGQDYAKGSYVYANDKAIADIVNGGLTDNNIASGAAIQGSKIASNLDSKTLASPTLTGTVTITDTNLEKMLPPIGTIIPFYDYNTALTFDSNYWAYCNGQTKTIGGVSRVLPDLSNRYLVGFGTEGGTDINTATWATKEVGNASHTNSHTHTGPSHTHTGPSHTHTGPSHTHTGPSHTHQYGVWVGDFTYGEMRIYQNGSSGAYVSFEPTQWSLKYTVGSNTLTVPRNKQSGVSDGMTFNTTSSGSGNTGASGTGATGASGTGATGPSGTGNTSEPSITSIQPCSIRCRFLMRIQ